MSASEIHCLARLVRWLRIVVSVALALPYSVHCGRFCRSIAEYENKYSPDLPESWEQRIRNLRIEKRCE